MMVAALTAAWFTTKRRRSQGLLIAFVQSYFMAPLRILLCPSLCRFQFG